MLIAILVVLILILLSVWFLAYHLMDNQVLAGNQAHRDAQSLYNVLDRIGTNTNLTHEFLTTGKKL